MTALSLRKVNKSFGNVHVLKDIDIEVDEGEFVVFVGPSGCGKSTLLRVIAGLEDASSGEIRIGEDLVNLPPPVETRHCDGVPELRALPASECTRQYDPCAEAGKAAERGD